MKPACCECGRHRSSGSVGAQRSAAPTSGVSTFCQFISSDSVFRVLGGVWGLSLVAACSGLRMLTCLFLWWLSVRHQAILGSDETTHVLENLDPDTEYDVMVTAIYPDESESKDLMGSERTCKQSEWCRRVVQSASWNSNKHVLSHVTKVEH